MSPRSRKRKKEDDLLDGYPFYMASDITEALEVATALKRQGHFDLFRGQIRSFPPSPSIFRPGVDLDAATDRLNRFGAWVRQTSVLASLHSDRDAILAVAQHYGIPTPLLDFTREPEIAAFFAADGEPPPVDDRQWEPSCIICVNRALFEESWRDINARAIAAGEDPLTRIVELDVRNLWRLQAQSGLFLDARADPDFLEMFSGFFRIVFPYGGPLASLPRESVYPNELSHLEILLEEYFSRERFRASIEEVRRELFAGREPIVRREEHRGHASFFRENRLPPRHESWQDDSLRDWLIEPAEVFSESVSNTVVEIRLGADEDARERGSRIKEELLARFALHGLPRSRSIRWKVLAPDGETMMVKSESPEAEVACIPFSRVVGRIWDGMRCLPFADGKIASCIANYLVLAAAAEQAPGSGFRKMKELRGYVHGVELASNIARTQAFATEAGLFHCVRSDILDWLKAEAKERLEKSGYPGGFLLSILVDPSALFEFNAFADLFAEEVIPSQALIRLEDDLIIFNPARVEVFGES